MIVKDYDEGKTHIIIDDKVLCKDERKRLTPYSRPWASWWAAGLHSSRRAAPQSNASGASGEGRGAGSNANPWACAGQAVKASS